MSYRMVLNRVEDISFETAASVLLNDPGFIAIKNLGRYSIAASKPSKTFSFSGAFVTENGHTTIGNPSIALRNFMKVSEKLPFDTYLPFCTGGIGFVTFEGAKVLRGFEPATGFSRYPQCYFGIYETVFIYDHAENTAILVAFNESLHRAEENSADLLRRLINTKEWKKTSIPENIGNSFKDERLVPDEKFMDHIASEARMWLRSEKIERIHCAQSASIPRSSDSPLNMFLSEPASGEAKMMFSHEGAFAILESNSSIFSNFETENSHANILINSIPSEDMCGSPLPCALKFIERNEKTHRGFYGGAFGFFDSKRLTMRNISHSITLADGMTTVTKGFDVIK